MSRFNVITNINGVGLQRDFELVSQILEELGHTVRCVQFNIPSSIAQGDINLFLEVVVPSMFSYAKQQYIIVNPEWFYRGWLMQSQHFHAVMCKTYAAIDLFMPSIGQWRCHYTGFFSLDLYDESVQREKRFLHVAGKSQTKNTPAVVAAWKTMRLPFPLTVVSQHYRDVIPNVTFLDRVEPAELKRLMNSHQFHLMPSMYEGFGHVLHEGFGCKAVVITTNQPPMNSWCAPPELLIDSFGSVKHHLADLHIVQAERVAEACRQAWYFDDEHIASIGKRARDYFLTERPAFKLALDKVINT